MTKFKRILKKTAIIIGVLVLVLFAANGLLNYYWGRQIENRLAAIRVAGEPVSLADMQGRAVKEQDNAAPLYRRAFKAISKPAAARDIEALNQVLYSPSRTPSTQDWDNARSALVRCDRIIALIEEAQAKPACQFPGFPVIKGMSQESIERHNVLANEHLQVQAGLRDATRLLCAKAILCAREGKTQDVVKYIQSALNMNDANRENAMLVDYLVDIATINITLANMRQALGYCQPSESELRQLDSALSRINLPELYKHAIEGERVHFLVQNYEFRKAGMALPQGDTLAYLDFVSRHLECTRMNYSTALSKGLVGPRAGDDMPFYSILTKMMAPVTAMAAGARYKCEAEIACGRTFLALRAYKARFGKYPRTLREVSSPMDWELPKDPFTGKDLVYKHVRSGFIVYSVGQDLKDNSGAALQSRGQSEKSGDIFWRVDR